MVREIRIPEDNEKMKINGLQGAVGPPGINRAHMQVTQISAERFGENFWMWGIDIDTFGRNFGRNFCHQREKAFGPETKFSGCGGSFTIALPKFLDTHY